MFQQHHAQLQAEAIAAYPAEACWVITPGECRQVRNIADDPRRYFRIASRTMAAAHKRGLLAIVHSHPDGPDCPSEADMRGQLRTAVPWGIVSTDGERALAPFFWDANGEPPPLLGRGFRHGVTDCYALIRDYYRLEHGLALPEFPRDWEWWHQGQDLYREGFASAGFRQVSASEARAGDMWFSQIRSPVPNHGGVLVGNGLALHHKTARLAADPTRLSAREPIGRWLSHITGWYRHEALE